MLDEQSAVYTAKKISAATGQPAYAIHDKETGEWRVQATRPVYRLSAGRAFEVLGDKVTPI